MYLHQTWVYDGTVQMLVQTIYLEKDTGAAIYDTKQSECIAEQLYARILGWGL